MRRGEEAREEGRGKEEREGGEEEIEGEERCGGVRRVIREVKCEFPSRIWYEGEGEREEGRRARRVKCELSSQF